MAQRLLEETTTQSIIAAFYEVYNVLGPGLLEKAYSGALAHELYLRGHCMSGETGLLRATRWEVGLLLHLGPKPKFYRFVSSNGDPRKYGRISARASPRVAP